MQLALPRAPFLFVLRIALVVALAGVVARPARAEGNVTGRASTEIAGYTDSVGVSVFTPSIGASVESPTAGWAASGRYLLDVVSAASPDIVATASPQWREVRHAGNVGVRYKPGTFGVALGGATSYTPDYLALSANVQLIEDLDQKNLTLIQGYAFGSDTIGRTGTSFSTFSNNLQAHTITLGLSRVVNPSLILGLYGDAILENGDQSKPYRYIPMFAPDVAPRVPRGASAIEVANLRTSARPLEQLPLDRQRFAVTGRLGLRTDTTTIRLEERFYSDSWGLLASTTDLRWFVDVSERVTVWPHLRFHTQGGVSFWERAYVARSADELPSLRTGDRELGPLSNFGLGAGIRFSLGKAGSKDDLVLSITGDGTYTAFTDAIYVKDRFSGFATTALEVAF